MALSRVVSAIFNVEKYRDLEIRVKGQSMSSKVLHSIDCTYSFLFPIPLYFAPSLKGFPIPLELDVGVGSKKTRMTGLPGREINLTIS